MSDALTAPARRRRPAESPPKETGPWPWLDRGGRFSAFKAAVLAGCVAPGLWLAYRWWMNLLGPEPFLATTRITGDWTIYFLLISLAVTPARWIFDEVRVLQVRRMLGLAALGYALVHLLLYVGNENWRLVHVLVEIVKRSYLSVGIVALIGLCVLGWTSTDGWLKRLGKEWKILHRVAYGLTALGILHFFMQSKIRIDMPVLMAGFFLWLMLWRAMPSTWRLRWWPLLPLAVLAAFGAAALEWAWYATQTKVPASRVLAAHWDWYALQDLDFRPAMHVLLWGVLLAGAAAGWRVMKRLRPAPVAAPSPDVRARRAARRAAREAAAGEAV
ncbi:sulfite oxidase heme-binding subunit YedZ [Roseomonas sp. CCTCC AB2023176]|uniref:sulfite oxidase heme-binding subunit YedZ n=1 Tax=Roseomonas sp. CCTCC AB2023176 TaxID=3342640 RepID=UPI0035DE5F32